VALFTQKKYTSVKSVNREIKEMATIDQNLSNNSDQNVNNLSLLVKATNFAAIAHKNQMRKDGKTPYINHPIGVTHILTELGNVFDINVLAAALLHDTVEDTDTTIDDIKDNFGEKIRFDNHFN
jgi:(p)ppGpp synthase/HD superfamily hydrolase